MKSDEHWRQLAERHEQNGAVPLAIEVLERAARAGEVVALVDLANLFWRRGEFETSNRYLSEAEGLVADEDWRAHFALHQAYLRGMGDIDPMQKRPRAFAHLRRAAHGTDNPMVLLTIAAHYEGGLNEVPRDLETAQRWYEEAARTGNPDATSEYERFKRSRR